MPPPKKKVEKTKASPPETSQPEKKIKPSDKLIDWDSLPKVKVPTVPTYKESASQPPFPSDYRVVKNCLLQVTDIKDNHNKFYSMELHLGENGETRLFTHYGRTDDLNRGGGAGQKEVRYYDSLAQAYAAYNDIYKKKTAAGKGYKPLNLIRMNSNIGSNQIKQEQKLKDEEKRKEKEEETAKNEIKNIKKGNKKTEKVEKQIKSLNLHPRIQQFISFIYNEATNAMTSTITVQITPEGIKTPLGILTLDQIQKGEDCLSNILQELQKAKPSSSILEQLSSDFYTNIPHHLGRNQAAIKASIIGSEKQYTDKMELMQLMKDMLEVSSGKEGNVLCSVDIDSKYKALGCDIRYIDPKDKEYKDIIKYISDNMTHYENFKPAQPNILNIFEIVREEERKKFSKKIGNEKLMFHGSRMPNWVGILTRGILLPEAVTKLGVHRTDFGWLGAGIYFGDVWQTSAGYTGISKDGTSFMCLANAALGKIYDQKNIDGKIKKPPKGFDSIHGNPDLHGGFSDHEYCIYEQNQQHIKYIVEFKR